MGTIKDTDNYDSNSSDEEDNRKLTKKETFMKGLGGIKIGNDSFKKSEMFFP